MTKITPKRAAAEAEAWWQARANGQQTTMSCSWCDFAKSHGTPCKSCPILALAGRPCTRLPIHERFHTAALESKKRELAAEIHALLVENRERLLEAAREILDEAKQ